jgi:hypothetical protein
LSNLHAHVRASCTTDSRHVAEVLVMCTVTGFVAVTCILTCF